MSLSWTLTARATFREPPMSTFRTFTRRATFPPAPNVPFLDTHCPRNVPRASSVTSSTFSARQPPCSILTLATRRALFKALGSVGEASRHSSMRAKVRHERCRTTLASRVRRPCSMTRQHITVRCFRCTSVRRTPVPRDPPHCLTKCRRTLSLQSPRRLHRVPPLRPLDARIRQPIGASQLGKPPSP
jgi:hypothetical protein